LLASLLPSIWSAGLILLFVADKPTLDSLHSLEEVARDSLFDLTKGDPVSSLKSVLADVIGKAESLKIAPYQDDTRKDS
jgi:hypothetical protein